MFLGSFCRLLDDEKYSLAISRPAIFYGLFFGLSNLSFFSFLPSSFSQLPTLFPLLSSPISLLSSLISSPCFLTSSLGFAAMQSLSRLWSVQSSCTTGIAFAFFLNVVFFCNLLIYSCISNFCIFPSSFLDCSPLFLRLSKYKDN